MKRTILSSLIVASSLVSAFASAATFNGGTIEFKGELVNAACAVSTTQKTVPMGQFRTASFTSVGSVTGPVPFDIELTNCDPSVGGTPATGTTPAVPAKVQVGFTGVIDTTAGDAIAIASGTNAAKGVALRILDRTNTPVALDGTPGVDTNILNQDMKIPFQAQYVSTLATPVAGAANATAIFTVTYQ